MDCVTLRLRTFNETYIGAYGERGLYRETCPDGEQMVNSLKHQPSSFNGYTFGIERREVVGYLVSIYKFAATQDFWQYGVRRSGLARTVASAYYV